MWSVATRGVESTTVMVARGVGSTVSWAAHGMESCGASDSCEGDGGTKGRGSGGGCSTWWALEGVATGREADAGRLYAVGVPIRKLLALGPHH